MFNLNNANMENLIAQINKERLVNSDTALMMKELYYYVCLLYTSGMMIFSWTDRNIAKVGVAGTPDIEKPNLHPPIPGGSICLLYTSRCV